MIWILLISLLTLMALFVVFKIGDAFSPWMLTTGVWAVILVMFLFSGHLLYPLVTRFYTCVALWVPILCATSIVTYYAFPNRNDSGIKEESMPVNRLFFNFFFLISVVFTPLYVYGIYRVVSMFDAADMLYNLRILANSDYKLPGEGVLKYVNAVNQALFIIAMWRYPKISKAQFVCIILANILCAVAIMEKGALFFMLVVALFVLYEKGRVRLRSIVLSVLGVFFLFYGFNFLRNGSDVENVRSLTDFLSVYILSPSVAFEQVQEKLTDQFGSRTLAFFYAVLSKLGLGHYGVEQKVQEFVQVPILTNVYTVFQPFFQDFGYRGVAFFASVYGVFTGWLYRQCRNGGAVSRCLYAYVAMTLVLQFYQENLILSLSVLIQYVVIIGLTLQQTIGLTFSKSPDKRQ